MGSPDNPPRDDPPAAITDEDGLHEALQRLVTDAAENGVDVRGEWPIIDGGREESWMLAITEVVRRTTAQVDDTTSPVPSIIDAVAAREGVDPTDLPPIYDSIDPGILKRLHESDDSNQRVQFEYHGYTVSVTSGGSIRIDG